MRSVSLEEALSSLGDPGAEALRTKLADLSMEGEDPKVAVVQSLLVEYVAPILLPAPDRIQKPVAEQPIAPAFSVTTALMERIAS